MAVSGGQVVVDILANTAGFTSGIAKAEAGMAGLATTGTRVSRSSASWDAALARNVAHVRGVAAETRNLQTQYDATVRRTNNLTGATNRAGSSFENVHTHARRAHIGFLGISSSTIGMGVGIIAAAQAAHEMSKELVVTGDAAFTTKGKLSNAFSALLTGNIIGVAQALQPIKEITLEDAISQTDRFKKGIEQAAKWSKTFADNLGRAVSTAEGLRWVNRTSATGSGGSFEVNPGTSPNDKGGTQGAGAISASNAGQPTTKQGPIAGLSQRLQTALAAAHASGNNSNILAQDKRAKAYLERQLNQKGLTDAQRESIYQSIDQINGEMKGIYDGIKSDNEKVASDAKQKKEAAAAKRKAAFNAAVSTLSDAIDTMQSALASAVQTQASAFGSLFGGPVLNPTDGTSTGGGHKGWFGALAGGKHSKSKDLSQKLNADLDAQVSQYQKLQANLRSLKKRGASPELISQLLASGDNAKVAALAGEGKGPLQHFFAAFNKGQALIKGAAAMSVQAKDVHLTAGVVHLTAGRGGGDNTVHVTIEMDGKKFAEHSVTHLQKKRKGRSGSRKGAHGGSPLGVS